MKVSKAQVTENRRSILQAAARLYRERGFTGVGVADITREAGLTHGGLYRHFESKDALAAQACECAFEWTLSELQTPDADAGADAGGFLRAGVANYLSPQHRDSVGQGCPVAALAADAARETGAIADAFAQGIGRYMALFARRRPDDTEAAQIEPEDRVRAIAMLSTMVGGLILARATARGLPALSDEILATLRHHLEATWGLEASGTDGSDESRGP
ncbi:TetR/AcrR family transcriptional regulator [Ideonella sp. BN130291]|uniref:TetR/AcrR family transcriptional regulator n=1 Tax=Ideonella sp. BN130291 TaxID=3112940 RepID=UPI002E25C712|nr:TetR/AcrR family transcriptional regulator [Ideonella sp. BN130291]